ncbi:hypothetical protein HGM15179_012523 [Zosterops borbonicus]|uniref:Uncharacterized protein n=1 Tax=Zosterops borbonicus TaxID=364589 RepID=A0A8K1LHT7_9PASS|nr:hypothetical protein HGM15179_012523 [Zosterops borbonicus]
MQGFITHNGDLAFYSIHMDHHMEHSLAQLGSDVPAVSPTNALNTSSLLTDAECVWVDQSNMFDSIKVYALVTEYG